jgi:hypothetical protein
MIDLKGGGLTAGVRGQERDDQLARLPASRPTWERDVHRLVALIVLTAAFAPAAVLGALPMVIPIVAVLITCWLLLAAWSTAAEPAVEAPVIPIP